MYQMDDETLKDVANKIRKFYFGGKPIDEQMCREICYVSSCIFIDGLLAYHIHRQYCS